jgi:glycerophosphoryl diester phosphodiesterase
LISTSPEARGPLLLGHRGAREYAPENTLEAFELALAHGCDGFEFDVRSTADGSLAIWHDPTVRRMLVARANYVTLCQRLQTGWRVKKAAQTKPAAIPCLQDVLAAFGARAYLNIEIKVPGIEREVVAAIVAAPPRRGYLVSSFQPEVVQQLRAINPEVPVGWIVSDRRLLRNWQKFQIDVLVAHHLLASAELVQAVHRAGRKLFVWTVNRPKKMQKLAEWGIDAIISDDTRLLSDTLRVADR